MKKATASILLLALTIMHSLQEENPPYRNIIYYEDKSIYSHFYPSQINTKYVTHIIFSSLNLNCNGDLELVDEFADFQTVGLPELERIEYNAPYAGVLGAIAMLRVKNPHLKIGISVTTTNAEFMSVVARDQDKREKFVDDIYKFISYIGFDFVDIDWQYPRCTGRAQDTENFTLLLQELRNVLDTNGGGMPKHFELSIAMSPSPKKMKYIEYDKVLEIVDFAHMITYDLNGGWSSYTAHQSPLYTNEAYNAGIMDDAQYSIDTCIKYLEDTYGNTIDMKKIVIGVAPFTRGWSGVSYEDGLDKNNPGLYATATPNSVKGSDGTFSGIYGFNEIPSLIEQFDLIQFFDNTAKAAYYYSPTTGFFFTCDNEESVAAKGRYVKEKGLGGLISWMASYDPENVITKAMFDSLYEEGYSFPNETDTRYRVPSMSATITTIEGGYKIVIRNNAMLDETTTTFKYAESFMKYLLNMKIYIKSKSGALFSSGCKSGIVTNENGFGVIDPSTIPDAKILPPSTPYVFTVKVSGVIDRSDIEAVFLSQRILPDLPEFKRRIL